MIVSKEQIEQGRAALAKLTPAERQKLVKSLAVMHSRKAKRAEREAEGARNNQQGA
ncbi:MAG: hypothetical protein L6Q65_14755 [Zoogloea sp.]|nr:hypothetical protein [Zoogloea sp.]